MNLVTNFSNFLHDFLSSHIVLHLKCDRFLYVYLDYLETENNIYDM